MGNQSSSKSNQSLSKSNQSSSKLNQSSKYIHPSDPQRQQIFNIIDFSSRIEENEQIFDNLTNKCIDFEGYNFLYNKYFEDIQKLIRKLLVLDINRTDYSAVQKINPIELMSMCGNCHFLTLLKNILLLSKKKDTYNIIMLYLQDKNCIVKSIGIVNFTNKKDKFFDENFFNCDLFIFMNEYDKFKLMSLDERQSYFFFWINIINYSTKLYNFYIEE